jgi:hypothetical protein
VPESLIISYAKISFVFLGTYCEQCIVPYSSNWRHKHQSQIQNISILRNFLNYCVYFFGIKSAVTVKYYGFYMTCITLCNLHSIVYFYCKICRVNTLLLLWAFMATYWMKLLKVFVVLLNFVNKWLHKIYTFWYTYFDYIHTKLHCSQ